MVFTLAGYATGEHKDVPDARSKAISFHESVTAQLDKLSLLRTVRVLTRR
ncbi:hypothetical protein [Burkholderia ambifaria]|jgi:protein-tyrosine phosphatase|uniref:Uncharacterized protein n=1 Tax=Burkholderia ambifaria IOP40-10 TaxID=396596 RepID=B1FFX7_9BURK|nr:hypothetical protein [Burkholderia ambifaria]EDT03522.1 hypothetical protein BamIOP4010DRAFT_2937 [Burkholderia ambifaria IOP40-10]